MLETEKQSILPDSKQSVERENSSKQSDTTKGWTAGRVGSCKALNVACNEIPIGGKVIRIPITSFASSTITTSKEDSTNTGIRKKPGRPTKSNPHKVLILEPRRSIRNGAKKYALRNYLIKQYQNKNPKSKKNYKFNEINLGDKNKLKPNGKVLEEPHKTKVVIGKKRRPPKQIINQKIVTKRNCFDPDKRKSLSLMLDNISAECEKLNKETKKIKNSSSKLNSSKRPAHNGKNPLPSKCSDAQNAKMVPCYKLLCQNDVAEVRRGKFTLKFNDLIENVQQVALTEEEWRVKVVVINTDVSEVVFFNKTKCDRCIKFYRDNNFDIFIGKVTVSLIASPQVENFKDLHILLDIVHNLKENDPILEYNVQMLLVVQS